MRHQHQIENKLFCATNPCLMRLNKGSTSSICMNVINVQYEFTACKDLRDVAAKSSFDSNRIQSLETADTGRRHGRCTMRHRHASI